MYIRMAANKLVRLLSLGTMLSLSLAQNPVCHEQMQEGSGDEQKLMYFYKKEMDACHPFYYKGLEGNGNRFSSDKECMQTCSIRFSELYPDANEVCKLPVDHGSCFAMLLMYYYSEEEGKCKIFLYGGCQGNGNRFDTREECQNTCMAKSGRFGGPAGSELNPDEVTTSVGLIVGILGGVLFAVSVIVATVFLIRERKQKAKRKRRQPAIEMN